MAQFEAENRIKAASVGFDIYKENSAERKASDKRSSMKKRLLERQRQVLQQVPPKNQKTKRIEHEL